MQARALLVCVVAIAIGCGASGGDADARRARWAAERQRLEASLDDLQARLLVDRARVRFWTEMKDRHESISAVSCSGLEGHAEDIARLLEGRPEKRYGLRRQVAARHVPTADPPRQPTYTRGPR